MTRFAHGALALVAVALSMLALGSHAEAQEMIQYRVREGDTCGSIAHRMYGNSRRYDLIHQHNPALGPMPHNLQAGTVLTMPRAAGSPGPDAVVTAVRRDVASQPPRAGQWSAARVGQELTQGWRVNTQDRSTAELTFRASSTVTVRERTLVIVYGGGVRDEAQPREREGTHAVVREGALLSRLSALSGGEPMNVETPSARATLRPGEASVQVDSAGTTRVSVHEGQAATVSRPNGQGALEVPAGMGTRVPRGRPPEGLRRLPQPPRWRDDAPRRFVAVGDRGGTLRARWSPSPDASRYRVEVARRADGRDLVFATEVDAAVREIEMHRLPAGSYFVRLATIDNDLFEGRPGQAVELTLIDARVVAPGATEPVAQASGIDAALADLDSGLADLDFESLPRTAAEVLQHSRLVLPEGVRCTLGQDAAASEVVLSQAGDAVLRCEGGEAIATTPLRVTSVGVRVTTDEGEDAPVLTRGGDTFVRVLLEGAQVGPALALAGGPGLAITSTEAHPRGGLRALVRAAQDAPEQALLRVTSGASELAAVPVQTVEGAPTPVEEAPARVRPHALQEGLGLAAFPSAVGLRDERRRGSGMHLALTAVSAREGEPDARFRITAGVRASFLEERLRLDVAVPLDVVGVTAASSQRGSRDVYAAVSSLILDDDELDLGLAAELGVWAPTAGSAGLDRGRLMVAVDLSYRLLEDRLALRTRQAGLFDLAENGSVLWASAYGFDVWIAGPLSAGVELSMVLGREDALDAFGFGVGAGLALDLEVVVISITGRYGVAEDAILGGATVSAAVRGSYEL